MAGQLVRVALSLKRKAAKKKFRIGRAAGATDKKFWFEIERAREAAGVKVVHSLRHRAQDRLRAAGCPEDVRWALLGHEEKTVASGYGESFPVPLLRKWIDKIGL